VEEDVKMKQTAMDQKKETLLSSGVKTYSYACTGVRNIENSKGFLHT
jgi:hypothetical protein